MSWPRVNHCTFCTFCYEPFTSSDECINSTNNIKLFIKVVSSYLGDDKLDKWFSEIYSNEKRQGTDIILKTCDECDTFVNNICEIYQQLKDLELKLDWNFKKLMDQTSSVCFLSIKRLFLRRALGDVFKSDLGRLGLCFEMLRKLHYIVTDAGKYKIYIFWRRHTIFDASEFSL